MLSLQLSSYFFVVIMVRLLSVFFRLVVSRRISYRRYGPVTVNTSVIVARNVNLGRDEAARVVAIGTLDDAVSSALSVDDDGAGDIGSTPSGTVVGVPSVASFSSFSSSSPSVVAR